MVECGSNIAPYIDTPVPRSNIPTRYWYSKVVHNILHTRLSIKCNTINAIIKPETLRIANPVNDIYYMVNAERRYVNKK